MNRYRNPWYKSLTDHFGVNRGDLVPFYENDAKCILEYRGVKVFRLFDQSAHYVLGDCCITHRHRATDKVAMAEVIDGLLDGKTHVYGEVADHIETHGYRPNRY